MESIDLALVRQQLHDDDGAREGQRRGDVECGHGFHPEAPGGEIANEGAERHLT